MNYVVENWIDVESKIIEEEMLELAMKEEQEYYEYLRINEEKGKLLDLIIKKVNSCSEEETTKTIKELIRIIERNKYLSR